MMKIRAGCPGDCEGSYFAFYSPNEFCY